MTIADRIQNLQESLIQLLEEIDQLKQEYKQLKEDQPLEFQPLQWKEYYDDWDNLCYEANSSIGHEDGPFTYRIVPRPLSKNRIDWEFDHDDELCWKGDEEGYDTLEAAQTVCQRREDELRQSFQNKLRRAIQ